MRTTTWKTKITNTFENGIRVRGYDLTELIGQITFGEMFYLLTRGELPSENVGKMIDGMLVALADHGIITTSVTARYAIASGTPLQGALAAGLLMIGDVYGGAVEQSAQLFHEAIANHPNDSNEVIARRLIEMYVRDDGTRLHGFGHPLHPDGDPRSARLLSLARELAVAGRATGIATAVEAALRETKGKRLPLNADGALAAVIVDLGFDWRFARSFMLLSRAAGILAHSQEELVEGKRWRFPPPSEHEVKLHEDYYQGGQERSFPAKR